MSGTLETTGEPPVVPVLHTPVSRAARIRDVNDDYEAHRVRPPRRSSGTWWHRAEGVLPRAKVRFMCFLILTLSLLAAGVVMILAVWDAAPTEVAWKAVATLGIISGLVAGFTILNEMFGPPRAQDVD